MATPKDKKIVTPDPAWPEFVEFLAGLFDKDNFPEKISLCLVSGRGCKTVEREIKKVDYKPNSAQPTHEALVSMSNLFLKLSQDDCDAMGKPARYAAVVWNTLKSDKPIGWKLWLKKPDPDAVTESSDDGGGYGGDDDFDDDSGRKKDKFAGDKLLARFDVMAKDHQWHQSQYAVSTGQMFALQQKLIEQLSAQNSLFMKQHLDYVAASEAALSQANQRRLDEAFNEMKILAAKEGIDLVKGLLPLAINRLTGKETIPTKDSPESRVVKAFIDSITTEEAPTAFGVYDEAGQNLVKTGIFTPRQTYILMGVAKTEISAANLEELFVGENAITPEQMMQAQNLFGMSRLMPIVAMAMELKKKYEDQAAQNTAAAPDAAPPPPTPKPDAQETKT